MTKKYREKSRQVFVKVGRKIREQGEFVWLKENVPGSDFIRWTAETIGKESEIVMGEIIPFGAKGHEKRRTYVSQSHLARNMREDETVRNYLHFLEEIEHMLHEVMDGQVRTVLETCIQLSGDQGAGTVTLCFQQLDFRSSHKIISKLQDEGWRVMKTVPGGYNLRMPQVPKEKQGEAEKFLLHALERAVRDLAWSDSVFNQEVNHVLECIESIRD